MLENWQKLVFYRNNFLFFVNSEPDGNSMTGFIVAVPIIVPPVNPCPTVFTL